MPQRLMPRKHLIHSGDGTKSIGDPQLPYSWDMAWFGISLLTDSRCGGGAPAQNVPTPQPDVAVNVMQLGDARVTTVSNVTNPDAFAWNIVS